MRKACAILLDHADELAWLEAVDTGNPLQAMRFDVELSAGYMDYFAGLVTEIKGDTIPIGPHTLNYTLREPLGVVARIGAFNHPLLFTAGKCGAPLVAGNTLIVKPADQTPLTSLRLADLWHDAARGDAGLFKETRRFVRGEAYDGRPCRISARKRATSEQVPSCSRQYAKALAFIFPLLLVSHRRTPRRRHVPRLAQQPHHADRRFAPGIVAL